MQGNRLNGESNRLNGSERDGASAPRFPWDDGIHKFPHTTEEIEGLSVEEIDRAIEMIRSWQAQRLHEMLQAHRLRPEQNIAPGNPLRAAYLRLRKVKKEQQRFMEEQVSGRFSSFLSVLAEALLPKWIFSPQPGYDRTLEEYNKAIGLIYGDDSAGSEKTNGSVSLPQAESGLAADTKKLQGDMERVSGDMWIALLREVRRQKVSGAYDTQLVQGKLVDV